MSEMENSSEFSMLDYAWILVKQMFKRKNLAGLFVIKIDRPSNRLMITLNDAMILKLERYSLKTEPFTDLGYTVTNLVDEIDSPHVIDVKPVIQNPDKSAHPRERKGDQVDLRKYYHLHPQTKSSQRKNVNVDDPNVGNARGTVIVEDAIVKSATDRTIHTIT